MPYNCSKRITVTKLLPPIIAVLRPAVSGSYSYRELQLQELQLQGVTVTGSYSYRSYSYKELQLQGVTVTGVTVTVKMYKQKQCAYCSKVALRF